MNIDFLDGDTLPTRDVLMAYTEVMNRWRLEDPRRYETWKCGEACVRLTSNGAVEHVVMTFKANDKTAGMRASDDVKGWSELQDAMKVRLEVSIETQSTHEPEACPHCERNVMRIKTLEARLDAIRRASVGEHVDFNALLFGAPGVMR